MDPGSARLLADTVLILHFAVVVFVVAGLALVLIGNRRDWRWVNAWWFRLVHLVAIGIIVVQSWVGRVCLLTTLESSLRAKAGLATYSGSFVEHWMQRILYHDAPAWVFALAYTCFGVLVAAVWWRYPPRSGGPDRLVRPRAPDRASRAAASSDQTSRPAKVAR